VIPSRSAANLAKYFRSHGSNPADFTIRELVKHSIDSYREKRAWWLSSGPDSDMLLFQWGTYDRGDGNYFQVDLVRQFVHRNFTSDPPLSQLHATTFFEEAKDLTELGASDFWCESRDTLGAFHESIVATPVYVGMLDEHPIRSEIRWEYV